MKVITSALEHHVLDAVMSILFQFEHLEVTLFQYLLVFERMSECDHNHIHNIRVCIVMYRKLSNVICGPRTLSAR